jgi:hypothetical protein
MASLRKPKPAGVQHWFDLFGPRGAPREGEAGHRPDPLAHVRARGAAVLERAVALWADGDWGPQALELLAREYFLDSYDGDFADEDDPFALQLDELPELLGEPSMPPEVAGAVLARVVAALGEEPGGLPYWLAASIAADALAPDAPGVDRPRLVNVPKDVAEDFVRTHHSKLPNWNYRGLLYALGVEVAGRLVAVATATVPSGRYGGRRGFGPDSVLELSRVASDRRVKGASSMLAARVIDLLPASGRRGAPGLLFVTYSLLSERGTTYLALADKGLRPVGVARGKRNAGGARREAGREALPHEDKIVWEAGPAAGPPAWDAVAPHVDAKQLAGAVKSFAAWREREDRRAARARARVA